MAKIYRVIQIELNQLISFRKCPHERRLTDKAYLSAVIVTNIYQSLSYKMARIWNQNYVTVALATRTLLLLLVGGVA